MVGGAGRAEYAVWIQFAHPFTKPVALVSVYVEEIKKEKIALTCFIAESPFYYTRFFLFLHFFPLLSFFLFIYLFIPVFEYIWECMCGCTSDVSHSDWILYVHLNNWHMSLVSSQYGGTGLQECILAVSCRINTEQKQPTSGYVSWGISR